MGSDRSVLERQIERVELRPFTLEGFQRRRQRKERNRRIRSAVVALAVATAAIGGLLRAYSSGDPVPANDPRRPFLGSWVSTDVDWSTQTMVIRTSGGEAVEIVVHDDFATVCSGAPSTMTGTGRLVGSSKLVIPSPALTCDDGSEPEAITPSVEKQLRNLTFVHDPESDSLTDNFEVFWKRVPREGPSPEPSVPQPYSILDGEVTFAAAPPWEPSFAGWDHGPTMTTLLLDDRYEERVAVMADPLPIETGCRKGPAPADAEALAQSIRSDPDLESTEPVVADVGGVEAVRMDVVAAAGASACRDEEAPQVVTETGLYRGHRMRLYLLDLPEGSARILAIAISAPEARFERVLKAATPVLDSFEFRTG